MIMQRSYSVHRPSNIIVQPDSERESSTIAQTLEQSIPLQKYMGPSARENLSSGVWEQQRHRPACASAQSDQRLYYSLIKHIITRLATTEISNVLASRCRLV